ncbi:MAG: winged helix-turn-helix transcriptional regulator [Nitrospirae bacterium]|nr:winged helix-turn-helix transcriptional regulator [Nitrospirota bacterium]
MFHRVHFIEKWGRGIKLIISKEPDAGFSEIGTKFITTFKRKSYYEGKKVVEKVVETTQKIIEAITRRSDITQKDLAAAIGITEDGVKYHITRLRKKGILKRIGPDKGGYWEVVKK